MCSGIDLSEGNRFLDFCRVITALIALKNKQNNPNHKPLFLSYCKTLHKDPNDFRLSKNTLMLPGKVIAIVTLITTEDALIHKVGLVTLLLLCTLILERCFLECQKYRAYKVSTQGFVKMTPFYSITWISVCIQYRFSAQFLLFLIFFFQVGQGVCISMDTAQLEDFS